MQKLELEDSEFFHYFTKDYDGITITFRQWKCNGDVDELFDENFAKANGYSSVEDMVNDSNMVNFIAEYGYTPTWLRLCVDGRVAAVIDVPSLINHD